jgi:hypothetical protein
MAEQSHMDFIDGHDGAESLPLTGGGKAEGAAVWSYAIVLRLMGV